MTSRTTGPVVGVLARRGLAWARRSPTTRLRRALQAGVVRPLLVSQVQTDVGGLEELPPDHRPVLLVANHASHLDIPLLLESLPEPYRERTGVAVIPGTALNSLVKTIASSVVFNTVPLRGDVCRDLLRTGWSVLVFGEPSRSRDGFVGEFTTDAAQVAIERQVPVIPVGIRGSFAAMPRGRNRPVLGWPGGGRFGPAGRTRPRVSVRFGSALQPEPGETAAGFTARINRAVKDLIVEDTTTWWQSLRHPEAVAPAPPAGSWRRIWEQSQSAEPGGQARKRRIWS
ncbi:hypothetical protein GCM10011575_11220 [Microlunatus endophyticus]|uniref:Phospholipid/glycerol acyltransferase domain-containing protein n=1 Tax=Microlunatus endophyticus TaxID=1716077 RepID=A0A917W2D1_9ACTN|nr:lysophospholipid acyltransferase family protein [Microlunatus endophyticus]GGL54568.1 hypothetical protein GCM10011575_11220 [Microlunatus endophyticus]